SPTRELYTDLSAKAVSEAGSVKSQEFPAFPCRSANSIHRLRPPEWPVNDLPRFRAAPTVLVNARWLHPIRPCDGLDGPPVTWIDDGSGIRRPGTNLLSQLTGKVREKTPKGLGSASALRNSVSHGAVRHGIFFRTKPVMARL